MEDQTKPPDYREFDNEDPPPYTVSPPNNKNIEVFTILFLSFIIVFGSITEISLTAIYCNNKLCFNYVFSYALVYTFTSFLSIISYIINRKKEKTNVINIMIYMLHLATWAYGFYIIKQYFNTIDRIIIYFMTGLRLFEFLIFILVRIIKEYY